MTWLRSSYMALSQISDSGIPMIEKLEFGPDQKDAFDNFLEEAVIDVSKLFSSRQGDANGTPFEIKALQYDKQIIYRFNESLPELNQASVLKSQLSEDVKDAIYSYISILWFNTKGLTKIVDFFTIKYNKISESIERNLYLLHD